MYDFFHEVTALFRFFTEGFFQSKAHEAFDEQGQLIDPIQQERIQKLGDAFVNYVAKNR